MSEGLIHFHHTSQCLLDFLCLLMSLNGLINNCNWKASWLILPYTIPPNQKSRMDTFTLSTSLFPPKLCPLHVPVNLQPSATPIYHLKPFTLPSPSALSIDFSFVYVHPSLSETSLPVILHIFVDLSHIGMGSWGTGETNQRSNVMEAPLTLTVPILRAVTHSWVVAHLQCLCDGCLPLLRLSSCSVMALCRY